MLPPPPTRPQLDTNNVDVKSGAVQYSKTDLSIGPSDNSGLTYSRIFSGGIWRDSFSNGATEVSTNSTYSASIAVGNFSETFSGFTPDQGQGSTWDGDNYVRNDGTIAAFTHYAGGGYDGDATTTTMKVADYLEFPNGVRVTYHYRDDTGGGFLATRLQSVTTNTGYQLKFTYQANSMTSSPASRIPWLTVTKVVAINNAVEYCDPSADSCSLSGPWKQSSYSYDSTYRYATDAANKQTRYTNASTSFAVKTPGSVGDNIVYSLAIIADPCPGGPPCTQGLAQKVTQANIGGKVTSYSYAFSNTAHLSTVTSTAPLSQQNVYTSDYGMPGVASSKNPLNQVTSFGYDSYYSPRLVGVTSPEGNRTQSVLDGDTTGAAKTTRGNVTLRTTYPKPGSALPPLTESWVFPTCTFGTLKTCNQPSSYTDPRGNVTSYTYSTAHGGRVTETAAPAAAGGIQAVKRYAYTQRYAWVKNSSGSYVHAPTPIWLPASEKTCRTSATVGDACAAGATDEVTTSYGYGPDSGPNNLLLRTKTITADGVSLTTCYAYDDYGNKISETSPRAGCS